MAKKARATAARKAVSKTRCQEGGDEVVPVVLRVSKDDRVDWVMFVCKANADVRLFRRRLPETAHDLLLHETGNDRLTLRLDPLPPGDYLFRWIAIAPAAEWQTRTELVVNEHTTPFRLRQTTTAATPASGMGFVIVQVA